MTVRELKDLLCDFDDDMEVVVKPDNSMYVESINDNFSTREVTAFYGQDFDAVVIRTSQVGRV